MVIGGGKEVGQEDQRRRTLRLEAVLWHRVIMMMVVVLVGRSGILLAGMASCTQWSNDCEVPQLCIPGHVFGALGLLVGVTQTASCPAQPFLTYDSEGERAPLAAAR